MNRMLSSAVALGLMATCANAAHIEFSGSLCLTAANPTCTANGWSAGACFATRFQPPIVGNSVQTKLEIFSRTYATDFARASGSLIGTAFLPVTVTKVAGAGYQYNATMRLTSQIPAAPTSSTPFITMIGDISGWDEIPGCVVTFKAAHTRCPQTFC